MNQQQPHRVITYCPKDFTAGCRILETVKGRFPDTPVDRYREMDGFCTAMKKPAGDHDIFLILLGDTGKLGSLEQIKDRLWGRMVLILLPSLDPKVLTRALKLYPRYVGHIADGAADLAAILENRIKHLKTRKQQRHRSERGPNHTPGADQDTAPG